MNVPSPLQPAPLLRERPFRSRQRVWGEGRPTGATKRAFLYMCEINNIVLVPSLKTNKTREGWFRPSAKKSAQYLA